MAQQTLIINNCIGLLEQAVALVKSIDDRIFVSTNAISPRGSIGGHLRHILDFYQCFLRGIAFGEVDYNERERDPEIAQDRNRALERIGHTIEWLRSSSFDEQQSLLVSTEDDGAGPHFWCRSSILRELVFLESHTIHHYSLIGMILRLHEIEPAENFGIAPSTLSYWKESAICAQ